MRLANGYKRPGESGAHSQEGQHAITLHRGSSDVLSTPSSPVQPSRRRPRTLGGYDDHHSNHAAENSPLESPYRAWHFSTQASTSSLDRSEGCQEKVIRQFEQWTQQHSRGSPTSDHLLTLVRFNLYRAFVSNIHALHLTVEATNHDEAQSPFHALGPKLHRPPIPPSLQPTRVQMLVPHHPWLDLFPIPRLRDNLIQAGNSLDEARLCHDLVGINDRSGEMTGIAIWGEAWDPSSWEVAETFATEWNWVLEGCTELLHSTNYWRSQRGEESLVFGSYPTG